jgi:hypothetical protein
LANRKERKKEKKREVKLGKNSPPSPTPPPKVTKEVFWEKLAKSHHLQGF